MGEHSLPLDGFDLLKFLDIGFISLEFFLLFPLVFLGFLADWAIIVDFGFLLAKDNLLVNRDIGFIAFIH